MERFANDAVSNLVAAGGLAANAVQLTVADGRRFPTQGNFTILCEGEYMIVTAVAGNVFTVTRGQEGTAASGHTDGAIVEHVVSARALNVLAAGGGGIGENLTVPLVADFAPFNQGAMTLADTPLGVALNCPATGGGDAIRGMDKALPAAPWAFECGWTPGLFQTNFHHAGMYLRNSGTAAISGFGYFPGGGPVFVWNRYSAPTVWQSAYAIGSPGALGWTAGKRIYQRMRADAAQVYIDVSTDGQNWCQMWSAPIADIAGFDRIGFYVNANHAFYPAAALLQHWKQD